MIVVIERSFLVLRMQSWQMEVPDHTNVEHVMAEHFGEFDEDLCTRGTFLGEVDQAVEDDQLTLTVVAPDEPEEPTARVIPFPQRGATDGRP